MPFCALSNELGSLRRPVFRDVDYSPARALAVHLRRASERLRYPANTSGKMCPCLPCLVRSGPPLALSASGHKQCIITSPQTVHENLTSSTSLLQIHAKVGFPCTRRSTFLSRSGNGNFTRNHKPPKSQATRHQASILDIVCRGYIGSESAGGL